LSDSSETLNRAVAGEGLSLAAIEAQQRPEAIVLDFMNPTCRWSVRLKARVFNSQGVSLDGF
jgi:hypothetical protein